MWSSRLLTRKVDLLCGEDRIMKAERLPETTKILLSELLERLLAGSARPLSARSSFVTKKIDNRTYWYLQRSEGATKCQILPRSGIPRAS